MVWTGRNRAVIGGIGLAVPAVLAAWSRAQVRAAERAVPRDGRLERVKGANLHVVEIGTGAPIVMVHGMGGQLRNFSYDLPRHLPDHRLILVDRPGSGYSVSDTGLLDIPAQAAAIADLIGRLGLDRPLVVGHSLGGAIALAMALDHPDRVGSLALIAPLTQAQDRVPGPITALAAAPPAVRRGLAWTMGTPGAQLARRHTVAQVFAPEPVPDDFATRGGALLANRPGNLDAATFELGTINRSLAAMVPRYQTLNLPVRILYGREDRVLDPDLDGRIAAGQIPGAVLELIPGGHMLPVTQPERVARFITAGR